MFARRTGINRTPFSSCGLGDTVRLALEVLVRLCIDAESGLHPLFVVFALGFESCQDIRVTPDEAQKWMRMPAGSDVGRSGNED